MHNLIEKHDVEGKINSPVYDKRPITHKIQQSKFKYYDTLVLQELCEDIGLKVTSTRNSLEGVLTEYLTSVEKSITDVIKERRTKIQIEQENLAKLEEMKKRNPETLQKYYLRKRKQEVLAKNNQQLNNNQATENIVEDTEDEQQFTFPEIPLQKQVSLFSEEYEKIITRNMPQKPYAKEQKKQQEQKKQWISTSQASSNVENAKIPNVKKSTFKNNNEDDKITRDKEIDAILKQKEPVDDKTLWEQADEDVDFSTDDDSSDSDEEDDFSPSEMEYHSNNDDSDYKSNDSMDSDSEEQAALIEEKLMDQQTYPEVECYCHEYLTYPGTLVPGAEVLGCS